ncbi:MAG: GNAT family N-acetyltransferase [Pseudomonadota bacterium]
MPDAPISQRLTFARFQESDAPDLAAVLSDPEVTRNITANAASPAQALDCAKRRIQWHNGAWAREGYGVWALRRAGEARVIGWCGFAEPDFEGEDPEILYGLARAAWGQGLGGEAARAATDWYFRETDRPAYAAMIFRRLNPGSLALAAKLGMKYVGTRPYSDFMTDPPLAREVLDYEIWRLREGPCLDPLALLFQAPYKAGQLVATGVADPAEIEAALLEAARERLSAAKQDPADREQRVRHAFAEGQAESQVDHYQLTRADYGAAPI